MTLIDYSQAKKIFNKNNLFIKLTNSFNIDTFEKVISIDSVRLKYKNKDESTVIHSRGEVNRGNNVEVPLYDITDDVEFYSGFINLTDIPYDLEEILEEREISFSEAGSLFDEAMLRNNLFEYGGTRRSHRFITDKAKKLDYYDVIEKLTDLKENEVKKIYLEISDIYKEEKMFEYAKELGFIIIDKDISKYIAYSNRRKK